MPATLGQVNVYLIEGPKGVCLIDTGMDDVTSVAALERALADRGLAMSDLSTVMCTHYHPDHCGIGRTLQESGARVLMSRPDADSLVLFMENPEVDFRRSTFFGRHAIPEEFGNRVTAMFPFFRSLQQGFAADGVLSEEEPADAGGIPLEVWSTPGHTRGHVCLMNREAGIVFTGDHVIPGNATHVSMREEVHGTDPLGRFVRSLERMTSLTGFVGLGGHGDPMPDVAVRADQLVRHHRARIERVAMVLNDEPRSAYDIGLEALGAKNKVFAKWQAMSQTLGYLEHLAAKGRAVEVDLEDGLAYRRA